MNSFQPATAAHALNTDAENPDAITALNAPIWPESSAQCQTLSQSDQSVPQE